jgi:hypothetical protein
VFLLLLTVAWSLYDEFYGLRPWRSYQREFAKVYAQYLKKQIPQQRDREKLIRESDEYKKLDEQVKAAEEAARPRLREIGKESDYIDRRLAALTDRFQEARGKVTALVYTMELYPVGTNSGRANLRTSSKPRKKSTRWSFLPATAGWKPKSSFMISSRLNSTT